MEEENHVHWKPSSNLRTVPHKGISSTLGHSHANCGKIAPTVAHSIIGQAMFDDVTAIIMSLINVNFIFEILSL